MRRTLGFAFACVLLACVSFAFALDAAAQPAGRLPRIGVLAERAPSDPMLNAFVDGMRELGYVHGRNVIIEWRYAQGANDRYPAMAAELLALPVDVLVVGGSVGARAAKAATATIPIVFTSVGDPVAMGLVTSLSRPGGNATGLSNIAAELSGKQLELLKLAAPRIARVAVLHDPLASEPSLKVTRAAARSLGVELLPQEVKSPGDLGRAISAAMARRADAILALSNPVLGNSLIELAALAAANRLPSIYSRSEFAEEGGLMAYGPSFAANYRRAAAYVDRILKGAKPAELPVEQPTTFELVVNLKAAKQLRLALPQSLVQRADRVIE